MIILIGVSGKRKNYPNTRIRTRDRSIAVKPLQSSALPTELCSDLEYPTEVVPYKRLGGEEVGGGLIIIDLKLLLILKEVNFIWGFGVLGFWGFV